MIGIGVKHLGIIIAIIYLSVTVSSDELDRVFTLTTARNAQTRETAVTLNSVDSPSLLQNGTRADASEAPDVDHTSKRLLGSEVSKSTESLVGVESAGNVTMTEDDSLHGNSTGNPTTLALDHSGCVDFGIRETAGYVTIGFLAFSVFGYVGFVLWRRYLQNKYGNGQTLITEDVYDVSDLRHFEI